MQCVKNLNDTRFNLKGDHFSNSFQYMKIILNPCVNGGEVECKSA